MKSKADEFRTKCMDAMSVKFIRYMYDRVVVDFGVALVAAADDDNDNDDDDDDGLSFVKC